MLITLEIDDASGRIAINVDRDGVPPPVMHWMLLKAAAAVFNPSPQPQSRLVAVPAGALDKIPGPARP